jgi:GNAT superfamily N-acetyltransferase
MNLAIVIRPARAGDHEELYQILKNLGWFALLDELDAERGRALVAGHLARGLDSDEHLVLVAEEAGGQVIGYASVHWLPYLFKAGPEAYVSELFVHPDRTGRGVGRALLAALENEARARGCCQLMLINNRQRPSYQRGFYAKQGWQERDNMANFARPL